MEAGSTGVRLHPVDARGDLFHRNDLCSEEFRADPAADHGGYIHPLPAGQGPKLLEALGGAQEGDGRFAAGVILQLAAHRRETGQGGKAL